MNGEIDRDKGVYIERGEAEVIKIILLGITNKEK